MRVRKSKAKRQAASDGGDERKSSNCSFILARELLARVCLEMGLSRGLPGTDPYSDERPVDVLSYFSSIF